MGIYGVTAEVESREKPDLGTCPVWPDFIESFKKFSLSRGNCSSFCGVQQDMRAYHFLALTLVLMSSDTNHQDQAAPQLVYGTYLGGRYKDFATAIAVDASGNAYVTGRTLSPDFPLTDGALITTSRVNNDDWIGFVTKINGQGDRFSYSTFLGGNYRSSANAVSVDSSGRAFVVGSTCSSNFPTTPLAILRKAPGSDKPDTCDGFLVVLDPTGRQLEYGTYLGGHGEDAASSLAVAGNGGVVYVGGYTSSTDFPVTESAVQSRLHGLVNGFLSAIDVRSGKLLYSTYLGGDLTDSVTALAPAEDGSVYVAGVTQSTRWPNVVFRRFGSCGGSDGFLLRTDPTGRLIPQGIRIGGLGNDSVAAIDLDSEGNVYVVGSTDSPDFPETGAKPPRTGSGFVLKIDGRNISSETHGVRWSRRVGGHGDDALLAVSAKMPGSVFVAGRSSSSDFPTTADALYRNLSAQNDSILMRLRASTGKLQFSTFVSGTENRHADWHNDGATGVSADASGNVYVTGYTIGDRLPVTRTAQEAKPRGNTEAFVLRMKFAVSE